MVDLQRKTNCISYRKILQKGPTKDDSLSNRYLCFYFKVVNHFSFLGWHLRICLFKVPERVKLFGHSSHAKRSCTSWWTERICLFKLPERVKLFGHLSHVKSSCTSLWAALIWRYRLPGLVYCLPQSEHLYLNPSCFDLKCVSKWCLFEYSLLHNLHLNLCSVVFVNSWTNFLCLLKCSK